MKIEEKISQAKSKLLLEYPYFGTLASRVKLNKNEDIESFRSDGKELQYNPDFFNDIDLQELEFVFANASLHAALAYENRKQNRSGWLWQMASDYAINGMLVENGLKAPDVAHYNRRFHGMYTEEIYAELKDEMLRDDELDLESDSSDDVEDSQNDKNQRDQKTNKQEHTKEELSEIVLEEKLFASSATLLLKQQEQKGDRYKSIERFFKLESKSKIDWQEELKSAIDRYMRDDYRLIPPNKKYLYMGIYLPSNFSEKFTLTIAVDSSGSIDEGLISMFLSEVNFLMMQIKNYEIELLVCDDRIRSVEKFYSGETITCHLVGGGGTDFRPVFEYIEDERSSTRLLLYFTDMDGVFPKDAPNYEVKWVSQNYKEAPFGEVILLEDI